MFSLRHTFTAITGAWDHHPDADYHQEYGKQSDDENFDMAIFHVFLPARLPSFLDFDTCKKTVKTNIAPLIVNSTAVAVLALESRIPNKNGITEIDKTKVAITI